MDCQTALSDEQEERHRDGLRILARIIARHYLEHPGRYPTGTKASQMSPPPSEPKNELGSAAKSKDG